MRYIFVNLLKANFCDSCCQKNIFFRYTNILYTCKKKCYKNTKGESDEISKNSYIDVCINSTNPENNIYNYCQNRFPEAFLVKTCKYDMCNLCCVNVGSIQENSNSYDTLKHCFQSCKNSNNKCLN